MTTQLERDLEYVNQQLKKVKEKVYELTNELFAERARGKQLEAEIARLREEHGNA